MGHLNLGFESPWYLGLLLFGLPLLWWTSFRSLAGLGQFRRAMAILLRSLILAILVLALAGIQLVWVSDRVTVMYLLDQSESIPASKRQLMLDYVIENVSENRNDQRRDKAGIIVFGRESSIEIPPFDDDIPRLSKLESYLDRTDATNLESAMKLAQASMPADTSRRIVIVTDGNENLGNARRLAARVAEAGIGIDVVPVALTSNSEVLVEKIDLPTDIRKGQPFEARIVLNNYEAEGRSDPVKGRLRVTQALGNDEQLISDSEVTLDPGKNVFPMRHVIDQPAPYTYRAEFVPEGPEDDGLRQNNQASAYTYVRGQGRVLLIEPWETPDQYALMVDRLRQADIEVVVQSSDQLYSSLEELQAYDAVILAGVPRVSGDSADAITSFSDDQIEMLVRNTQQLGCGLLMIGGPQAFGNGGWADTKLEEAMPVNFRIRNSKIEAVGALAMIMHASEMAQGNFWQKEIARKAIEAMGPSDYAGVLHWDFTGDRWLWGGSKGMLPVGPNRRAMLAALGRMSPGDMPQFDPAMQMAVRGLSGTDASLKHCIIISDGDPSDPMPSTIQAFKDNGITITTVAVATHGPAESARLRDIAQATGGKYYQTQDARALPKIFQREARRVSRPLNYEPEGGVVPAIVYPHPIVEGLGGSLPNTSGFVLTEVKDSPLVQVIALSPKPEERDNATILAVWNYGLGRTAVLTTDSGSRWAQPWTQWNGYDKFFSQLVRWIMRPTGDTGKFSLATRVEGGRVEVVVLALDEEDQYQNFIEFGASALGPNLNPIPLQLQQVAPGRYVGSIEAERAGSYFINVVPGAGQAPLSTGISVPYSDEYRVREANTPLLTSLASVAPKGGEVGVVYPSLERSELDRLVKEDVFRGGLALARSTQDVWPWFVFTAACLFLADVAVRRITIDFIGAMKKLSGAGRRGSAEAEGTSERLRALMSQKERIGETLDRQRAASRFEVDPSQKVDVDSILGSSGGERPAKEAPQGRSSGLAPEVEGKSYTERLMEAKRRARGNDRDNKT